MLRIVVLLKAISATEMKEMICLFSNEFMRNKCLIRDLQCTYYKLEVKSSRIRVVLTFIFQIFHFSATVEKI